nr:ABC transporter substrate-binding protein [Corynebacterium lactis]
MSHLTQSTKPRSLAIRVAALAGLPLLAGASLVACGTGQDAAGGTDYPERLVLADRDSKDNYHPASGYGQTGISPVYDGLLRPSPEGGADTIPALKPALADGAPVASDNAKTWTVKLRDGVKFSDGSAFDAEDVKATYDVARDSKKGSKVSFRYDIIEDVEAVDPHTVKFHLSTPYSGFESRLTLSIAPSEVVGKGNVADNPLAEMPVGTGPYVMESNSGNEIRFKARDDYWAGAPEVKEMVVSLVSDDNARAQRVASGELSGAAVPPALAKSFEGRDDVEVVPAKTADWRGVSFPDVPFLKDPQVRRAINMAVDRDAIVAGPLSGYGTPISNVLSSIYGAAYNAKADFSYDAAAAEKLLDQAGWKKGPDGIRAKDGEKASVTLYYAGDDTLRRDMAIEFSAQMKKIGVDFHTVASTWDEITPRLGEAAALLGGGSSPYDPDLAAYNELHSRGEDTSEYSNPGNYGSPELDRALEQARVEQDPAKRAELYRKVQELHADNPVGVFLANINHVYLQHPNKWDKGSLILEPHIHGATWGPWWDLRSWKH